MGMWDTVKEKVSDTFEVIERYGDNLLSERLDWIVPKRMVGYILSNTGTAGKALSGHDDEASADILTFLGGVITAGVAFCVAGSVGFVAGGGAMLDTGMSGGVVPYLSGLVAGMVVTPLGYYTGHLATNAAISLTVAAACAPFSLYTLPESLKRTWDAFKTKQTMKKATTAAHAPIAQTTSTPPLPAFTLEINTLHPTAGDVIPVIERLSNTLSESERYKMIEGLKEKFGLANEPKVNENNETMVLSQALHVGKGLPLKKRTS